MSASPIPRRRDPIARRRRRRRRRTLPDRAWVHLRANPAPWVLFVVAAAWLTWFAYRINSYFVMPDELRYVRQAVAWGTGHPVVPGAESWVTWSQLQPILMAPLWSVLRPQTAYQASQILMAICFASVVFPTYLLARDVLRSQAWALVAAALAVVIPWSVMTGVLMLENVAYPVFMWTMLALARAAVQRTTRSGLVAAGALVLAFFARTQFLVLWPVLPFMLLAQELRFPTVVGSSLAGRVRSVVVTHRVVFAALVIAAVAYRLSDTIFLGDAPRGEPHFNLGTLTFAREYFAYVTVGIGVLPVGMAAAWVLWALVRPVDPATHAYAVLVGLVTAIVIVFVGGGSKDFIVGVASMDSITDRFVFYVAPLLLIGMLALLRARPPGGGLLLAVCGAGCAGMVWASQFALIGQTFVTPSAAFHLKLLAFSQELGRWLDVTWTTRGHTAGLVSAVLFAVVAAAWRWVPARVLAPAVALLVGGYCVWETTYTQDRLVEIQPPSNVANGRDWVDRRIGDSGRAVLLLSQLNADFQSAQAVWWDVSFWNKRVVADRHAIDAKVKWDAQAVTHPLTFDPANGGVHGIEGFRYLLRGVVDRRFQFVGEQAASPPVNNLQLLSLDSDRQLRWWFEGIESGFVPAGHAAVLRVYGAGLHGRARVSVAVGVPIGTAGPASFSVRGGGTTRRATVSGEQATAALVSTVVVPAHGYADLTIRAGRGGAQFFDATVT